LIRLRRLLHSLFSSFIRRGIPMTIAGSVEGPWTAPLETE
jgi:hypothetical protein